MCGEDSILVQIGTEALELASEEDTTQEEQKMLQGIVSFGF